VFIESVTSKFNKKGNIDARKNKVNLLIRFLLFNLI